MFKKCPACGKRLFRLFAGPKCPQCGSEYSMQSIAAENAKMPARKEATPPLGLSFPTRTNESQEDELKSQHRTSFEMGNIGTVILYAEWNQLFRDRPLDIPKYTALKGRAVVMIYLSSQNIPREEIIPQVLESNLPLALQVQAVVDLPYPIVRCNFVIPDNPKDPLILETPLDIRDGNVQDFFNAIFADEHIDLILKHESSSGDVYCPELRAPGLAKVVREEVAKVIAAMKPQAGPGEWRKAVSQMEKIFPSGGSGVRLSNPNCVRLHVSGEARNKIIEYGDEGIKPKPKTDERMDGFVALMRKHGEKLIQAQANDPAMQSAIRDLLKGQPLESAARMAIEAVSGVEPAGGKPSLKSTEKMTDGFLMTVTVCNTNHLPTVAGFFPNGYFHWLVEGFVRANSKPADPPFAHWIFLFSESGQIVTHLSITQKDKRKNKVLAWDLLTPQEFQQLGLADMRPAEVRRQWGLNK